MVHVTIRENLLKMCESENPSYQEYRHNLILFCNFLNWNMVHSKTQRQYGRFQCHMPYLRSHHPKSYLMSHDENFSNIKNTNQAGPSTERYALVVPELELSWSGVTLDRTGNEIVGTLSWTEWEKNLHESHPDHLSKFLIPQDSVLHTHKNDRPNLFYIPN